MACDSDCCSYGLLLILRNDNLKMNVHNPIRLLPGENIFIRITEKVQALIEVWLSGQLIITNFRIIFQVEKSDDVKVNLFFRLQKNFII